VSFRNLFLVLLLTLFGVLFVAGLSDHGITWDSAHGELFLGDRYFHFWTTLDPAAFDFDRRLLPLYQRPDHPDFFALSGHARENAHHIWGFGPALTAASKELLFTRLGWLDPIDAHHAVLGVLVMIQVAALFGFAFARLGPTAAVASVLCLASYPRYWAHLHNNPKDVPESVLFTLCILSFVRGVERQRAGSLLLAGALGGLALATKANALFLPLILGPWLIWWWCDARRAGKKPPGARLWAVFAALPLVAVPFLLAGWPYLLSSFPDRLMEHLSFLASRALEGPGHWQSAAVVNLLITMPLPVMVMVIAGIAAAVVDLRRHRERRGLWLLITLWLVVPILRVSLPYARDFDVLRHWIEFLPALSLIAGFGAATVIEGGWRLAAAAPALARLRFLSIPQRQWASACLVVLWLSPVILWNATRHPYQLVFYNSLVGGLGGAQERGLRGATDYWGSSYRSGLRWVNRHVEPNSMLMVGAGERIVRSVRDLWLRPDVELVPAHAFDRALDRAAEHRRAAYLMTITRREFYPEALRRDRSGDEVVHEIRVDGGVLLRILRLTPTGRLD
jgi:hypothetical protein